jgi:hypothetical protein
VLFRSEAKLLELEGVAQATVVLRNDDGLDQLVAFVTSNGAGFDPRELRIALRHRLPAYMTPSRFELLTELPRLPSGKANRNALKKQPLSAAPDMGDEQEEPRTETEARLLEAAKSVLPPQAIPFDADFFTDLGGHSLLAARFLALVRKHHDLASLTLQDVYQARSLRAMAGLLEGRAQFMAPPRDLSFTPPPLLRRFLCGLAQAITLPIVLALMTAQWLGVFVSYMLLTDASASLFAGNRLAARRLYLHQHRDGVHRHLDEVDPARAHEAGALSPVGRLLFPLVARPSVFGPAACEVVPGLARHAALSARAGRPRGR